MNKFKSKKGFTLAELLIVVAIIAVLVAIAVPLFVGSLQKAEKATEDANIRAVRGTAAVYILDHTSDTTNIWPNNVGGWDVEATISSTGDITITKLQAYVSPGVAAYTEPTATRQPDGGYKVTLSLTNTEVKATTVAPNTTAPGVGG